MCKYNNGNYLWDSTNEVLIKIGESNTYVDGVNTTFPIPLNEDILELLGFNARNAGYEDDKNHFIEIRGASPESLLWFNGLPVKNLHELQNEFSNIGDSLIVDETKLQELLEKKEKNNFKTVGN